MIFFSRFSITHQLSFLFLIIIILSTYFFRSEDSISKLWFFWPAYGMASSWFLNCEGFRWSLYIPPFWFLHLFYSVSRWRQLLAPQPTSAIGVSANVSRWRISRWHVSRWRISCWRVSRWRDSRLCYLIIESCASPSDSLISLNHSMMPAFSTNSFQLFNSLKAFGEF